MIPIEFANVSKKFIIHHRRARSFQDMVVNLFRPLGVREEFWALSEVSFQVREGEALGIIGENGSGKSTVLKLISRIMEATSGKVTVGGKVAALLELGAGFHPDLSGRDNIFLNSSILGLGRRETLARFSQIVDFAELERFIDTPIKHYSSGMHMRLAFAIATSIDPQILLVDEILAVGDESFQRKCLDRMSELRHRCKAIVFVSHDLMAVHNLCTRVIWLDGGKVRADGPPNEVLDQYLGRANEKERARFVHAIEEAGDSLEGAAGGTGEHDGASPSSRWGSREIEIVGVDFLDSEERESHVFGTGEMLVARIRYRASQRIERPVFGVAIHREDGVHINAPNTRTSGLDVDFLEGEGEVRYVIPSLPLLEGSYQFSAAAYDYSCSHPYDHHERAFPFKVQARSTEEKLGTFLIPCRWELRGSGEKSFAGFNGVSDRPV